MSRQKVLLCTCFIALMLVFGFAASFVAMPGAWYASLNKPSFNPPNWIFGPVWTILYVLIGMAGGIVAHNAPRSTALKLWFAQAVVNVIWSPVFFGLQMPAAALVVIVLLLLLILSFMRSSFVSAPVATWLFAPYAAWVAFATVLNASIVWLN